LINQITSRTFGAKIANNGYAVGNDCIGTNSIDEGKSSIALEASPTLIENLTVRGLWNTCIGLRTKSITCIARTVTTIVVSKWTRGWNDVTFSVIGALGESTGN
jgi:hypothetical protein